MVPEEEWDYTCTQPMMLAELQIEGRQRQVLMQAPKNGFFYVLDRDDREADQRQDLRARRTPGRATSTSTTGRPVLQPGAHNTTDAASDERRAGSPRIPGTRWRSTRRRASSISRRRSSLRSMPRAEDGAFTFVVHRSNGGQGFGSMPELRAQLTREGNAKEKGYLLAWDPRTPDRGLARGLTRIRARGTCCRPRATC